MASPADTLGFSIPGLVISGVYSLMQGLSGRSRPPLVYSQLSPGQQRAIRRVFRRSGAWDPQYDDSGYGRGPIIPSGAQVAGPRPGVPRPSPPGSPPRRTQSDFERMMGRQAKPLPSKRLPKIRTGGTAADKLGRRGWGWREAGKWLGRRIFIPPWLRRMKVPAWARMGTVQGTVVVAGSILVAEELIKVIAGVETTPPISPTPTPPGRPARPRTYPQPPPVAAPAPGAVVITEEMPAPVTWLPPVPKPKPAPWYQRALQAVQPWLPLILPLALPKSKGAKAPVTNISFGSQTDTRPFTDPLTAFYSGGVASTRTGKQCECKPKRKRKPKDPRRVCYRGTYIETPTGLKKRRGKRISCRPSSGKRASPRTR